MAALTELSSLLWSYDVQHWAAWIEHDRELIDGGDDEGIRHFLSAFGGMGSLNDLIIHPANGHPVSADQVDAVNDQFQRLKSEAYGLAGVLR
ncbi:DUF6966 domain-containing protein [Kitasatospora sp. NBC_01266]|uniref:DUF6966 domain-containing protein n=1 Tax=Kitasatospora sp. NBC_01266 TaxID=2903572 RepID=UPI002E324FFE|nr:hypothetical protein [Kitasatospora sp. NBC_01266]